MSFVDDYQIIPQTDVEPKTIILYGPPKVGKTTLACKISEQVGLTVLLNHENRVGHIDESDILRHYPGRYLSCDLTTAQGLLSYMRSNPHHGIKAIMCDTIDSLIESEKRKMRLKTNKGIGFAERDIIHFQVLELLKAFKDLGCVVVITSHDKTDNTKGKVTLSLDKDMVIQINKMSDFIFYICKDGENRKLITDSEFFETGASLNKDKGEILAKEIINPSWSVLFPNMKAVEPVSQYITKDQQLAFKELTADVAIIKAILKELGYESSGLILTTDYDDVFSRFKSIIEAEQAKNKQAPQNQCTVEDYTKLINEASTKEVLAGIKATYGNEFSFSRDEKGALDMLIIDREKEMN